MLLRSKFGSWVLAGGVAIAGLAAAVAQAAGLSLVINANSSDPAPRAAWEALVPIFAATIRTSTSNSIISTMKATRKPFAIG